MNMQNLVAEQERETDRERERDERTAAPAIRLFRDVG